MTRRSDTFQDFRQGPRPKWSARAMQNISDSARRFAEARVGPGMNSRGDSLSQHIPPPSGLAHTIKVVAVVEKPEPGDHLIKVQEVTYKFEGSDFVMPVPLPDPLVVAPVPGTLRWRGETFFALPGYTDSVADFASTVFDNVERDDAGQLILVDGRAVEILPDDTTILHWLYLRPQGPPALFKMGGGGSTVQQFRIVGIANGYLIAQPWDSKTRTAGNNTDIWMPWTLRVPATGSYTFRGFMYEYVAPQERIKRFPSGAFEEQIINPPYHDGDSDNDIIYARFNPLGGIASSFPGDDYGQTIGSNGLPMTFKWIDTNNDGRAWAQKFGS